ncbi:MAG TPA: outer-membrane lipoprotein carrier protein LolA [Bosea sp. (in: a-proteobacteria)]|jgi:outer membrane lipoprotein-sorting protein|nr:outer-membrane lipoprotein carrier protein LolA [Bosea sp. (in: a-proteobacteria)]
MTNLSPMPAVAAAALALALAAGQVSAQPLDIKPSGQPAAAPRPAQRAIPLPPIRPAGLGMPRTDAVQATATTAAPTAQAPAPVVTANNEPRAATAAKSSRPSAPLSKAEAVERLNTYFNGFSTLQGDFIQFAADGRRFEGKLYVLRPGKMRFEYRPPVTMEVVADGTSVAIRDRKLATQDLYSIGQTPLKFLLKEQISLERDTTVTGVSTKGDILSLKLEDRSTLGGTSKITLNFDLTANELRQWVVIDPQGYETSVSLYNLDTQRRPDQKNFVIDYQRVL